MAGHSKFKNIMHRKKAVDAKRSRAFSKHGRLIMNAARIGGGDLGMNLSLRYAVDRARSDNMPKDAIERAIAKGTGEGSDSVMEEVTYEGYGPGGVAISRCARAQPPRGVLGCQRVRPPADDHRGT